MKLTKKEARVLQMDYIQWFMVETKISGKIEMAKPLGLANIVRQGILEKIDKAIGKFNSEEFKKLLLEGNKL